MLPALLSSCAGLDVHKKIIVATLLQHGEDGDLKTVREYQTYPGQLARMALWLKEAGVQLVVMESTGVYWKSAYEALEEAELPVMVVNALHVKKVPGRKTDVSDSEWLAELARCGLLKGSFIPPKDLRELRLLTRYRVKMVQTLASEKNRLHKVLDDCGIRLGAVVSDIDGVSAREMIAALIAGDKSPEEIAGLARGRLRDKSEDLRLSLEAAISDRHRYLLIKLQSHMRWLQNELADIEYQIVAALEPYRQEWQLLQTIPGMDEMNAAMLLVEIGPDMDAFKDKSHLSSWAGMCPGNNASAGKKSPDGPQRGTGMSKGSSARRRKARETRAASSKTSSKGSLDVGDTKEPSSL